MRQRQAWCAGFGLLVSGAGQFRLARPGRWAIGVSTKFLTILGSMVLAFQSFWVIFASSLVQDVGGSGGGAGKLIGLAMLASAIAATFVIFQKLTRRAVNTLALISLGTAVLPSLAFGAGWLEWWLPSGLLIGLAASTGFSQTRSQSE